MSAGATRPLAPVPARFFRGATDEIARRLIGARLVHRSPGGPTVGRIVETEAYLAEGDRASHSHAGETARNASMFLAPGHAYIYLIYGMHLCFNVVTARNGVGEAVLVRALEPLEGVELMRSRRGGRPLAQLCNGPGKLVQAMGFGRDRDGHDLRTGALFLSAPPRLEAPPVLVAGPRVGITKSVGLPLRFRERGGRWSS